MDVKYPEVEVDLVGVDGNAFAVMGAVTREMKRSGIPTLEIDEFRDECMSGDYDHLLQTCMKWVSVS